MTGLRVWRLARQRYVDMALTGEGARLAGGRWNPVGVPVIYASLSLSLAVLEVFVHMRAAQNPEDSVSIAVDLGVSESQAERIDLRGLPSDWRRLEHPMLQQLGKEWVESGRSLVLLVPSVVVEGEWNAVINPGHPHAASIEMDVPKLFRFDQRMFQKRL